jgi:hypothetical protein|tara:strand:+ start:108 stop:266 length:159 start_codon:yes stop_codon:yes gene_type:complete
MKTTKEEAKEAISKLITLSEYIEEDNLLNEENVDRLQDLLIEAEALILKINK